MPRSGLAAEQDKTASDGNRNQARERARSVDGSGSFGVKALNLARRGYVGSGPNPQEWAGRNTGLHARRMGFRARRALPGPVTDLEQRASSRKGSCSQPQHGC